MQGWCFACHRTTCGRKGAPAPLKLRECLYYLYLPKNAVFNLSPNLHFFLALMVKLEFFVTKKRSLKKYH